MSDETRILMLSPPLTLRGTTIHTRNLIRSLRGRGYKFHLVAHPGTLSRALEAEGAVIHPFPITPGLNTWLNLPRLARLVQQVDPRIIHLRHHTLTRIAGPLLWRHPRPLVVSVSTPPAAGPLRLPRHTKAVLAVSDPLAEELVAAHKTPRSILSTVKDCTFVDEEPPPLPDMSHPVVGCMGRLEKDRGVDKVPLIARRVVAERPQVKFALVGEGEDDMKLRRSIRRYGLSRYVHVSPPPADYRRLLKGFHLLLSPALKEGLGIFALEAMAMARPVVAAAVGGVFDLVKDGQTGVLTKPGDEEEIAASIIELLDSRELLEAMGLRARELVRKRFRLQDLGAEMDLIYRHALAEAAATGEVAE